MEFCISCREKAATELSGTTVCFLCETKKIETVELLRARIAELEHELQQLRNAAEKGDKLLKVMWGDNFNSDSLF